MNVSIAVVPLRKSQLDIFIGFWIIAENKWQSKVEETYTF